VREFSPGSVIDTELVVSERPSLFMTGESTSAELGVIRQAGIPVVANHEWLEPTALARAEWLKYMAVFLNEERSAQRLYSEIKARYLTLSARALAVPDTRKPTVMTGRGMRGEFAWRGLRAEMARAVLEREGYAVTSENGQPAIAVQIDDERWIAAANGTRASGDTFRSLAAYVRALAIERHEETES
jgi:iron complex transport system substrate-binding protein